MKKKLFYFALVFQTFMASYAQGWTVLSSPTSDAIKSCWFVTDNVGWIITDTTVFKTTDGGISWGELAVPSVPSTTLRVFNSVHFISANVGVIGCGNTPLPGYDPATASTILWTNDGGLTWEYKDLGSSESFVNDVKLVDNLTAYAIGKMGRCKKTVDGGMTWTLCNFDVSPQFNSFKLAAITTDTVYFAGLDVGFFTNGAFGSTVDGGSNWNVFTVSNFAMRAISFQTAQIGFLGGGSGVILGTNDGGDSWVTETTDTADGTILDLSFANPNLGWAVTDSGRILHTVDSGATWNTEYTAPVSLRSVCFSAGSSVGFAVGDSGTLLKYDASLGVDHQATANNFAVYPNPSSGAVTINLVNAGSGAKSVSLYTLFGQLIKQHTLFSDSALTIDRDNVAAGVYLATVSQGNDLLGTTKIVFKD